MNKLRNHAPFGNSPTRLKDVKPSACASCYGTGTDVTGKQCSCCSLYIESDNMGTQVINEQSYVTRITSLESQLADALAVIAKKDEALIIATTHMEMYSLQISHANDYKKITEAIDLNLGDVTLVEVGTVKEIGGSIIASSNIANNVKIGTKLYKIQTKE